MREHAVGRNPRFEVSLERVGGLPETFRRHEISQQFNWPENEPENRSTQLRERKNRDDPHIRSLQLRQYRFYRHPTGWIRSIHCLKN